MAHFEVTRAVPTRYGSIGSEPISPVQPLDAASGRSPPLPHVLDLGPPRVETIPNYRRAFTELPVEVINRILWLVDSNGFASLCLVNQQWYRESQKLELYAHHLSRCPSFALSNNVITGPFRKNDLFRLKTKFAEEVRRNLFSAYLRPRKILINIISRSANSSAAFPGGEAFRFAFSPNGQTLLALSSSRIFVLDLTAHPPRVARELKTIRRAVAASVTDDASLLAVLSSKHQANVYGLTPTGIQHLQVIVLDNPPRTIAMAHRGTVLAAAYDTGIEVFSLAANALSTDRRAVRCEAVDSLDFSGDGSMLIGSSKNQDDPNAVVISAPFYAENDPEITPREAHSRQWTTQILFPNNSASISHAALIPNHLEGDANWVFAFDHILTTYRAVRTDDTRTGIAYFLGPPTLRRWSGLPFPSTPPAVTADGDLVAAGFQNLGICLYGVPERLDVSPDMGSVIERNESRLQGPMALTTATGNPEPLMAYSPSVTGSSESIEDDALASRVDWRQSLFIKCRKIKCMDGVTAAKWVERSEGKDVEFLGKRLATVAPGGVSKFAEALGDESMPVDGGRIMLHDFDYISAPGPDQEITIEVGEAEAELLPEHHGNLDVEIAMERRRTVRHTRGRGSRTSHLGRSVTAITPPMGMQNYLDQHIRRESASQPSSPTDNMPPVQDMGSPFSQNQPRSYDTLQRAATAAGVFGSRYPPRPPLGGPSFNRRPSNDSWESPPPPYSTGGRRSSASQPHDAPSPMTNPLPSPVISPASAVSVGSGGDTYASIHASMQIPMLPTQLSAPRKPVPQQRSDGFQPPNRNFTEPTQRVTEPFRPPLRAETSFIPPAAPGQSMHRSVLSHGRTLPRRGMSDSSLDTVTEIEMGNLHAALNFPPFPTASAVSSPVAVERSQPMQLRRPASHDGSNRFSMMPLGATLTHPVSPPTPDRAPQELIEDTTAGLFPPQRAGHDRDLSLTGSNLQNRLNQPMPPPPTSREQLHDQRYIPSRLQPGNPLEPALLPQDRNAEPFTQPPPTGNVMAHLSPRMSYHGSRPSSTDVDRLYVNGSAVQHTGQPPMSSSGPRNGWRAGAGPTAPTFERGQVMPNGLLRQNVHKAAGNMSAPNLTLQQRPHHVQLHATDVCHTQPPPATRGRERHSAYADDVAMRARSAGAVPSNDQPGYMQWTDEGRSMNPDPKMGKKMRKMEKKRKDRYQGSDVSGWDDERNVGKAKKGLRCVVM